jgi:hypothetical protein
MQEGGGGCVQIVYEEGKGASVAAAASANAGGASECSRQMRVMLRDGEGQRNSRVGVDRYGL